MPENSPGISCPTSGAGSKACLVEKRSGGSRAFDRSCRCLARRVDIDSPILSSAQRRSDVGGLGGGGGVSAIRKVNQGNSSPFKVRVPVHSEYSTEVQYCFLHSPAFSFPITDRGARGARRARAEA